MPKFLEKKLAKQYGEGSPIIYKIMNKLGYMRGSHETAKGQAAEIKHKQGVSGENNKDSEVIELKSKMMGKKDPTKPVTEDDKVMSQKHKDRRETLSHNNKSLKSTLDESDNYNLKHAKEHIKAYMQNEMVRKYLGGSNAK